MFARNAHLTDESEVQAKLDLADFVRKGALRSPPSPLRMQDCVLYTG